MLDLLITNALIADGSGKPAYTGSVGIAGERIVLVTKGAACAEAKETIDASGLVCSPGFIDGHGHADVSLAYYPEAYNLICQGITTFVGGNCGIGLAPALRPDFYQPYFQSLDIGDLDVTWKTFGEWLDRLRSLPLKGNYVPLVGLNVIRGSVLGADYARVSTDDEIRKEEELLTEALDAGAFGMSFSLDPGISGHYADQRELNALMKILDRREVIVTAHTRHHQTQWPSEDGKSFYGWFIGNKGEAVCGRYQGLVEFMEYYRRFPHLRSIVSHLTNAYGVPQPHSLALEHAMLDESIRFLIDDPVRDGCDVWFNAIPDQQSISSAYRIASVMIRNMPYEESVREYASEDRLIEGLKDEDFRRRMKAFVNGGKFKMTQLHPATDPYWGADYVITESTISGIAGKSLMQITKERHPGTDRELVYDNCVDTLFELLLEDPKIRGAMSLDKREFETRYMLRHERSFPITDTYALPPKPDLERNIMGYGTPPVAYSIFVRYLIHMCREEKSLTLEEGIRRMTALPAQIFRITERGEIKEGNYADLVLFRFDGLSYRNDFTRPSLPPEGIGTVIVNGKPVMRDGKMQEHAPGKVLGRHA